MKDKITDLIALETELVSQKMKNFSFVVIGRNEYYDRATFVFLNA